MKKLILPIIFFVTAAFFLSPKVNAQAEQDCRKIFDKEIYKCLTDSDACSKVCLKGTEKPDGSSYINSGEIYKKCMKESECEGKSKACNEQALANFRACGKSDQKPQEAKKETSVQDKKGVNVFKIFELFQEAVLKLGKNTDSEETWKKIKFWEKPATKEKASPFEMPKQERKLSTQEINDWIMENNFISDPVRLEQMEREKLDFELYGRTPQMTEETIRQYKEEWNKMFEPSEKQTIAPFRARADILKGKAEIKYPGKDEWVSLKQGDIVPLGATLFTGMDTTLVFSIQDKGVFQVLPFTEITVSEENIKENSHTDIKLNRGEIEVSVPGGVYTGTLQVTTPSSTTSVRGTHFWVSYDRNKRVAVTGVYEGKVEMKDTGGVTLVAPSGGKPGIAVVMKKLSIVKLVLVGVVLAAVFGGAILILRRKFTVKGFNKKKK